MGAEFSKSFLDSGYINWLNSQYDDDDTEIHSSCLQHNCSQSVKYCLWNDNRVCDNCKVAIEFKDFYVSCCGKRYCSMCYRSAFTLGHKCLE